MFKHLTEQAQRQPDNIEIVTVDLFDHERCLTLYAVGAGLIHRLARGDIGVYLIIVKLAELDLRALGAA